jgi:hypothetical protein
MGEPQEKLLFGSPTRSGRLISLLRLLFIEQRGIFDLRISKMWKFKGSLA